MNCCANCYHLDDGECKAIQNKGEFFFPPDENGVCDKWMEDKSVGELAREANYRKAEQEDSEGT